MLWDSPRQGRREYGTALGRARESRAGWGWLSPAGTLGTASFGAKQSHKNLRREDTSKIASTYQETRKSRKANEGLETGIETGLCESTESALGSNQGSKPQGN